MFLLIKSWPYSQNTIFAVGWFEFLSAYKILYCMFSLSQHFYLLYNIILFAQQRSDKTTAFHMACGQGSMPIVKYLASKDPAVCRITLVDFKGKTPLHLAAGKNHKHIVEFLLENVSRYKCYVIKENSKQ